VTDQESKNPGSILVDKGTCPTPIQDFPRQEGGLSEEISSNPSKEDLEEDLASDFALGDEWSSGTFGEDLDYRETIFPDELLEGEVYCPSGSASEEDWIYEDLPEEDEVSKTWHIATTKRKGANPLDEISQSRKRLKEGKKKRRRKNFFRFIVTIALLSAGAVYLSCLQNTSNPG
jgi:hypothetical protein